MRLHRVKLLFCLFTRCCSLLNQGINIIKILLTTFSHCRERGIGHSKKRCKQKNLFHYHSFVLNTLKHHAITRIRLAMIKIKKSLFQYHAKWRLSRNITRLLLARSSPA
ncbi:hypothetical protein SEN0110B [Salmonella enterica subsp. enterica serovar Enteritidis str. P125109]|uniref:Uncharacterized protein n=2 Tax=Salmonella enteritidis TaxID=149539 RepID=A0A6C7HMR5_SALEP|nr:hypothetical protein A672_04819 [Salmonella enterica subsp. enterica serovar Enteritidis str. 08-1080]EPI70626.1 hypothetical protein A673_02039 [Salmonella enterica subsp. enterica serovar Enteritidis str. 2009K0958]EPI82706.1 hypothetical protein A675_03626 [Salmonella enterica subsp. enterica serovar Enteritidis str. 2009K1726]EPI85673.1 hypothetical protein A674_02958 [Salmonella enterica subsp. enterica serovar Enteritidis str. 2009K1651]EPI86152.1 hypothetical protein A676_01682 [Salmo